VSSQKRILVIGQTAAPTGYARIMDALLPRLSGTFEIEQVAIGAAPAWAAAQSEWPVHVLDGRSATADRLQLLRIIRTARPQLLLVSHDLAIVLRFSRVIRAITPHVRVVAYGPIDGPDIDPGLSRALLDVHRIVTFTPHAAALLRGSLKREASRVGLGRIPMVNSISLGLDHDVYRPLKARATGMSELLDRSTVRNAFFGSDKFRDAFIVLNANRNVIRKRIDLTVEGFANFAARKPSHVFLYLHMWAGQQSVWDLRSLVRRHAIADRTLFTAEWMRSPLLSQSELSLLYNSCDVGVNTAVGEGWGLVSWEHAATGAAQLVPDHTACRESWGSAALLVRSYRSLVTEVPFYEEYTIDPRDLAAKLELLYADRELLLRTSQGALLHSRRPEMSWDAIASAWRELLTSECA